MHPPAESQIEVPSRIETAGRIEIAPPAAPRFVVGPDGAGHWLAVETHGLGGGIFVSQDAALHYARAECRGRADAVALTPRRIALR